MHSEGQPQRGGTTVETTAAELPLGEQSRVDELAARLRAANADSTLTNLILDNWQRTVGTVAIVFLGFWLYHEYQAKQGEQIGELSRRFDEARRSLVTLTVNRTEPEVIAPDANDPAAKPDAAAEEKKIEEKKNLEGAIKGANDTFDLLQTTGSGTAYATFAEIYRSLAAAYQGDPAEAVARLKKFNPEKYYNTVEPAASKQAIGINVTHEAAALLSARLTVAFDPELARKELTALALSGQFVNSEALLSLFRIAENAEQKKAAEATARRVILARPEQLDQIQANLAPFGFKSET